MLSRAGLLPHRAKGMVTFELPLADKAVNIGLYTLPSSEVGLSTFTGSHWNPMYVSTAMHYECRGLQWTQGLVMGYQPRIIT